MNNDEKSILISEDVHKKLKHYSKKTGIKMKILTETAIIRYLKRIKIMDGDEELTEWFMEWSCMKQKENKW